MLPDRVSNPGPLTYESGALPIALRGPALGEWTFKVIYMFSYGQPVQYTIHRSINIWDLLPSDSFCTYLYLKR